MSDQKPQGGQEPPVWGAVPQPATSGSVWGPTRQPAATPVPASGWDSDDVSAAETTAVRPPEASRPVPDAAAPARGHEVGDAANETIFRPRPGRRGYVAPTGARTAPVGAAVGVAGSAQVVAAEGSPAAGAPVAGTPAAEADKRKDVAPRPTRRTRRARLRLSRIDPWSVMKTAFLFSIAGGVITFVSVWAVWAVIENSGVLTALEDTINGLVVAPGSDQKFEFAQYISQWKVLGFTAMLAAADVVIITALATLFSFLYNLSAQVLGGLEVTLAED